LLALMLMVSDLFPPKKTVVFILCNAIISGVSVWNYFIAQAIDNNRKQYWLAFDQQHPTFFSSSFLAVQVDAFVIAVGALGLGFIFPV
jgi:hypothetical protein